MICTTSSTELVQVDLKPGRFHHQAVSEKAFCSFLELLLKGSQDDPCARRFRPYRQLRGRKSHLQKPFTMNDLAAGCRGSCWIREAKQNYLHRLSSLKPVLQVLSKTKAVEGAVTPSAAILGEKSVTTN
jgi:hypothetical protein